MSQRTFRVALAGWGLAGRYFHAPFIAATPGLELAAVATSREPEPDLFPGLRTVATFDALLAVPDLDVVVIATPNALHVAQARAALQAGHHVVVEKPVAPASGVWAELAAFAAQQGRLLVPFHNRRWDGDFRTVQALLADGRLGAVHFFASSWPRYRPEVKARGDWKATADPTAGVLYDLGAHLVDQALVLFGVPQRVAARVERLRPGAVNDDWMRITLDFPPSAANPPVTALLEVDSLNAMPGPRFHVRGQDATYAKSGLDPQEEALRRGEMPGGAAWGGEPDGAWGTLTGRDGSAERVPTLPGDYGAFYRGLYDALNSGTPPPVSAADATLQLRVLEAARHAAETGDIRSL
ncbi:MAG: Gfo/Idh/MocA family oxidoreductase [Anaerolineae bacterium]|nr:Gfo/Idh/MocA family oxidoreductase [Anaerolineae bacterium]